MPAVEGAAAQRLDGRAHEGVAGHHSPAKWRVVLPVRTAGLPGVGVAWLLLGAPDPAAATVPAGSELQVNTYTTLDQDGPAASMDADGDFVVVWRSEDQDGSSYGVFAQRFASSGALLGGEFQGR